MELKDAILSTLAEIESVKDDIEVSNQKKPFSVVEKKEVKKVEEKPFKPQVKKESVQEVAPSQELSDELKFLKAQREKLLVLFEGFQSPNNANIEAKIDLTINFLEYMLSMVEERIDKIKKS